MSRTRNYTIRTDIAGAVLTWAITGQNLSAIYTGPTSGSVTTNANGNAFLTFTLTSNTTTTTATFTLTVTGGACGSLSNTISIGGVAPPPPPPPPPEDVFTTVCNSVSVPVVYCPVFDGNGAFRNITVERFANFKRAPVGGLTVPLSVGVVNGSIVVTNTVNIDPANVSGTDIAIITAFDGLTPTTADPLITGTTTTVKGWF